MFLFFKGPIKYNELVVLQNTLSRESYCITKNKQDNCHFGVIPTASHIEFLDVLSGETLSEIEYLDEEEFKKCTFSCYGDQLKDHFIGNTELLNKK